MRVSVRPLATSQATMKLICQEPQHDLSNAKPGLRPGFASDWRPATRRKPKFPLDRVNYP
jgi:hypothetical protein